MTKALTALPIPAGTYKIQAGSVDKFIELPNPNAGTNGKMLVNSPSEADYQKWDFVPLGSDRYEIMSKATPAVYLGLDGEPKNGVHLSGSATKTTWVVKKSAPGDSFALCPADSSFAVDLNTSNEAWLWEYHSLNKQQMWKIIPTNTSTDASKDVSADGKEEFVNLDFKPGVRARVSDGAYRIRNLNPIAVLEVSTDDGDVHVSEQQDVPTQKWDFKRLSNGNYHISSIGQYLSYGATPTAKVTFLKGLKEACEWELRSVGGFACSFVVPKQNLVLGFKDFRVDVKDRTVLMNSLMAHCQIWILEPWQSLGVDSPYTTPTQIKNSFKVPDGKYLVSNDNAFSENFYVRSNGGFMTVYIKNQGDYFTLAGTGSDTTLVSFDGVDKFMLATYDDKDSFYICSYPNKDPNKVLAVHDEKIGFQWNDLKLNDISQRIRLYRTSQDSEDGYTVKSG